MGRNCEKYRCIGNQMQAYRKTEDILRSRNLVDRNWKSRNIGDKNRKSLHKGKCFGQRPLFFLSSLCLFPGGAFGQNFYPCPVIQPTCKTLHITLPPLQYFRRDHKISLLFPPPSKKKLKLAKLQKTTHNTTNNTATPSPQIMARRHDWLFF